MTRRLRMFPLHTVLFPHGVLPLHVFEPRYLAMISEALADDATFGVVLIERGSDVGGRDSRFTVGCEAKIVRAGRLGEGRLAVVALGVERFRVKEWLADDPYPIALVSAQPDPEPYPALGGDMEDARRKYRRLMAFASELGADVGTRDLDLPEDPGAALWNLCSVAPIEQLDRQLLLEIDDPRERVARLCIALDEQSDSIHARLSGG
ncbi:MAG: LON peptidase substrate-binding domain-containing protein [Acidimicrobiia bacterium]